MEIVIAVLVAALVVVSAFVGIAGLLGIAGAVRFVRCDRCHRLGISSRAEPVRTCVHCRHGRLLHPVYSIHHVRGGGAPGHGGRYHR